MIDQNHVVLLNNEIKKPILLEYIYFSSKKKHTENSNTSHVLNWSAPFALV